MKEKQQELMFKLQMFEQQAQQIQQQMQAVGQAVIDMTSLDFGLSELVSKEGKEIMAPVGRGIFVKAKLISEELVVDVGSKNFVTKTIPQTKELIKGQIDKLSEVQGELEKNLRQIGEEFNNMIMEAQKGEEGK